MLLFPLILGFVLPFSRLDKNIKTTQSQKQKMAEQQPEDITTAAELFAGEASPKAESSTNFVNANKEGDIPSFGGDEQAKATDFANYFCSYAQLYHQKQMLADHHRMASYHSAILGNSDVFRDKVVMDIGTGSGILAVWAAQAGARKVYAIEYTDMANYAQKVMEANQVDHIVTVIQSPVEEVKLPIEKDGLECEVDEDGKESLRCVDIIVSEWMVSIL